MQDNTGEQRSAYHVYLHSLDVVAANNVDLDGHCGRHLLHSHTSSLRVHTTLSLSLSSSTYYTSYCSETHANTSHGHYIVQLNNSLSLVRMQRTRVNARQRWALDLAGNNKTRPTPHERGARRTNTIYGKAAARTRHCGGCGGLTSDCSYLLFLGISSFLP